MFVNFMYVCTCGKGEGGGGRKTINIRTLCVCVCVEGGGEGRKTIKHKDFHYAWSCVGDDSLYNPLLIM
jgi:hypothetical protein